MPLICVPVTEKTAGAVKERMREAADWDCEAVEWRADAFEGIGDPSLVRDLLRRIIPLLSEKILIFTIRTSSDGGHLDMDRGDYFALCKAADECGCDMVDVEFNAGEDDVTAFIREKHSSRVIVSYHDFEKTPPEDEMRSLMRAMVRTGADAVKLAVMPRKEADADSLMDAVRRMHEEYADIPFIAMSMGETGRKSRYLCERFGSSLTFAAVGEGSAPGQLPLSVLRGKLLEVHAGKL